MSVIETIAAWCVRHPAFSDHARQLAQDAIADTLGCLYAGRDDFSTQAVQRAWAHYESQPAAIIALLNGTAAHAIDYDDNFGPGMSHASAVLVPALLAVALEENRDGKALTEAYLIGLQAQAFVGEVVSSAHYTAGWHGTSTIGCIGTAAGVAWLKGLDEAGIARTLSIAVSLASGIKGQFGTPLKPFHAGMAARNAIDAAQLAACEMTGRLDIIECDMGFYQLFDGAGFQPESIQRWLTLPQHVIETVGVMPKKHPCCGSTHRILDAIADLQALHAFSAEDVESVATKVGISNLRNLAYQQPQDEMQARFSMHYCVAVMLEKGMLSVADFTPEQVQRQADAARLARVSMSSWSAEEEAEQSNLPHIVTIMLKDGRTLTAQRLNAKGSLAEPFSAAEKQQKFADCCAGLRGYDQIWQRLGNLPQESHLGFVRKMMV
ncbi:2-methylcitrate dehydratase PrpD [Erwinia toletana]|uniref:2-methylcitrate dehydratase PrpD n=1 Tax=Winslowiella toletana TaxID=92490 RepID=A0ABS4PCF9_9GAMM|nr:MmgE/PrpD family protein [Winslowiella toletana]MBP2169810.1 2-methylcitrate dehydratase PrpD [Winslowiella toletana]